MTFPGWLDSMAIAPFRWIADPIAAFWVGSAVLALVCLVLGQVTTKLALWGNGALMRGHVRDASRYQKTSLDMIKAGQPGDYSGVNRLANEAFGKAFFLGVALGAAGLWPLFFAAAWMELRFSEVRIPVGIGAWNLAHVAPLLLTYAVMRVSFGLVGKRLCRMWQRRAPEVG